MTTAAPALRHRPVAPGRAVTFVRRHVLTAYSALAFAYLLLPIVIVIAFSFNNPAGRFNYVWEGFTLDNWRHWDGVPGLREAMVLSLEIALIASIVATALGTLIAWRSSATASGAAARRISSSSCRCRRRRSCSGPRC